MKEDEAARSRDAAMEAYLGQEDAKAELVRSPVPKLGPPAGWYPHPTMAETQRYWDGKAWTDHIAPGRPAHTATQTAETVSEAPTGLITAGVIMMVIFPIGGFIAGCVLLNKAPGRGMLLMLLSVLSAIFWYQALTPDPVATYGY